MGYGLFLASGRLDWTWGWVQLAVVGVVLPAADLDRFAATLKDLAPGCRLLVLDEMQTAGL